MDPKSSLPHSQVPATFPYPYCVIPLQNIQKSRCYRICPSIYQPKTKLLLFLKFALFVKLRYFILYVQRKLIKIDFHS